MSGTDSFSLYRFGTPLASRWLPKCTNKNTYFGSISFPKHAKNNQDINRYLIPFPLPKPSQYPIRKMKISKLLKPSGWVGQYSVKRIAAVRPAAHLNPHASSLWLISASAGRTKRKQLENRTDFVGFVLLRSRFFKPNICESCPASLVDLFGKVESSGNQDLTDLVQLFRCYTSKLSVDLFKNRP